MSRKTRDMRLQAEERWPTLFQFLGCYCHEDAPEMRGSVLQGIDKGVADYSLERRKEVLVELRDWMGTVAAKDDIRDLLNDGMGVNEFFEQPIDARNFVNSVHDKLRVSIRREHPHWTPSRIGQET